MKLTNLDLMMMMDSIQNSSTTSLEVPETPKLPLELFGKIMLNFDDGEQLEELKKCRLISPHWFKGVQHLYEGEFYQKYIAHFDGSKHTIDSSKSFGYNIYFGDYQLNYAALRISNSDQHLLENCMKKLITMNLQILELQNNLLNLEEIINILGNFENLVHFKYIQGSSEDIKMADKIAELFPNYGRAGPLFDDLKNINDLVQKKENFLYNLTSFEVHLIHIKILNFLSFMISCSECELKDFLVKIDVEGVRTSSNPQIVKIQLPKIEGLTDGPMIVNYHLFGISMSFDYFTKFSKSLKKINITVDQSKIPIIFPDQVSYYKDYEIKHRLDENIMSIFDKKKLVQFKALEELIVSLGSAPYADPINDNIQNKIMTMVKSQTNLKKIQLFMLKDRCSFDNLSLEERIENFKSKREFLRCLKYNCLYFQFGYSAHRLNGQSILKLLEFSQNLTKIDFKIVSSDSTDWPLSHKEVPEFPNCLEMKYMMCISDEGEPRPTFQIPSIVEKFPNLEKFTLMKNNFSNLSMTNEELQLIIRQYKNMKELHLINCSNELKDCGLTGLTEEALRIRSTNPDLPIKPEEQIGLPISHLKSLESFAICIVTRRISIPKITDLSAKFGFEGMKNLRTLRLMNTEMTPEGFQILKEKTGLKNLIIQ